MGLLSLLSCVTGLQAVPSTALFSMGVLIASYIINRNYQQMRSKKGCPLPPGPRGWPIIGNALDMPLVGLAPVYAQWAEKFDSDIVSASALGTTVVVINSYDAAIELLEKRAAKYSCRPVSVMACDLMGWNSIFVLNRYSEMWRERRKLFVKYFRPPSSSDGQSEAVHVSQVYEFVQRFLLDLNEIPREVYPLTRHMVGCLAISLAYGFPLQRRRDELVQFVDSIVRMISKQVTPGNAIVDIIPWLKYVPAWLPGFRGMEWVPTPGMGFKRFAKSVRWKSVRFKMEPYERALKAFGTEGVRPSFLSDALATLEAQGEDEEAREKSLDAILDAAATIFATAGDTSTNAIHTFIFALATHPQIRKQIQDELDSVLLDSDVSSPDKRSLRLPTFEDQHKLPRLMAAVMESQRWAPVTPTGVPHATTEDDIYKGFFIPRGSVVMANQWSMLNDEREYGVDVLEYRPDRFLTPKGTAGPGVEINPDVRHPNTIAFGFGRRACPGSHIGESTLWLTAACLLTLFNFDAPTIGNPNYVNSLGKVDEAFDPGFLCRPKEFECEFKLRSEEARVLMEELRIGG